MSHSTIRHYQRAWDRNATQNAMYAVLSSSEDSGHWDADAFFASGFEETARVFRYMETIPTPLPPQGHFLDFGCGLGRNTRSLMQRFEGGTGVDISGSMIKMARSWASSDRRQAKYTVNTRPDLTCVAGQRITFVYSHIVLQHMSPALQGLYIAEFLRVLAPGGIAAFQILTGTFSINLTSRLRLAVPQAVKRLARRIMRRSVRFEMHPMDSAVVARLCTAADARILAAPYTNSSDSDHNGVLNFMSRSDAIGRITRRESSSPYLSQFFFVQKLARISQTMS